MTQLDDDLATSPPLLNPKLPHTRALLSSLARQYKADDVNVLASSSTSDNESESEKTDPLQTLGGPEFVRRIAGLLRDEDEAELRKALKEGFATDSNDFDSNIDQHVLDLMHKHRDDTSGVPFSFLTPVKRPLSRTSSRASQHSFRSGRPDTPTLLAQSGRTVSFSRRPHTPVSGSPLTSIILHGEDGDGHSTHMSDSPSPSPKMPHMRMPSARPIPPASLSSSDLNGSSQSPPRFLNAKAVEFRPSSVRPLSSASGSFPGGQTPPSDMWAHNPDSSGSLLTPSFRTASNLAIAAPLLPESPSKLPRGSSFGVETTATAPEPQARAVIRRPRSDTLDDEQFSPFFDPSKSRRSSTLHAPGYGCSPYDPDNAGSSSSTSASSASNSFEAPPTNGGDPTEALSYMVTHMMQENSPPLDEEAAHFQSQLSEDDEGSEGQQHFAMDGMTPLEVLMSVFGSTMSPEELDDALAQNSYDFEAAMAWLIDRHNEHSSMNHTLHHQPQMPMPPPVPRPHAMGGGRVLVVPRDAYQQGRPMHGNGRISPRYGTRAPAGGNRVCRYFLQGECRRADCRFSHDIDRALCRFWLRGQCAKGEQCEFVHQIPPDFDAAHINAILAGSSRGNSRSTTPPVDEFPQLGMANRRAGVSHMGQPYAQQGRAYADPSRTRFATAVKRPAAGPSNYQAPVTGARFTSFPRHSNAASGSASEYAPSYERISHSPAPRTSPRIRLRPPSLLPTLPTGASLNAAYMSYRSRAIQLGAARNSCLARAADAWRRGDGAAAKQYSRDAQEMNVKMASETAEAATKLIRERVRVAAEAVRNRDVSWSDDSADRTSKGKACGGGLGVVMGVASASTADVRSTSEERMECLLDLHGLHSNEAVEVLEDFLVSLEREHYLGLAYLLVGEEKHTGTQDAGRGASRSRLAAGVREWLHHWGFPWSERDGVICVDPLTHAE